MKRNKKIGETIKRTNNGQRKPQANNLLLTEAFNI